MVLKKRFQNEAEVPISGGRAGESGEWMMLLYPRVNDCFKWEGLHTHEMCCCVMKYRVVVRSSNHCLRAIQVHSMGDPCHLGL